MPIFETSFDESYFWKYLWKSIYEHINSKRITLIELENKIWMKQPHISTLLNWKRTTKNLKQYEVIALWAWITKEDFDNLVKEARRAEYEHSIWIDEKTTPLINLDFILSKEFWVTDKESISDIKKYIRYIKSSK